MNIIGIDPANVQTAAILLTPSGPSSFGIIPNEEFIPWLLHTREEAGGAGGCIVVCEMIASYGMPVGKSIFDTCVFIGRILAACPDMRRLTRIQVKSAVCHSGKAKDANIRQALIDLHGPAGTKHKPGPTYGISKDVWAALAVATAFKAGAPTYN